MGNTWTSEWNLVCDNEYMKSVGEMFFLVGVATGGLISGYLSDKFGRKTMLFISVVFQTIFGRICETDYGVYPIVAFIFKLAYQTSYMSKVAFC